MFATTNWLCRGLLVLAVSALGSHLVGCSVDNGAGPALSAVEVTPSTPSTALGTSKQLSATAVFSDGTKQDVTSLVTWVSSDENVATVSNLPESFGLVQTHAAGKATISARYPRGEGSTALTVTAATIVSLAVTPAGPTIAAGTTQQFKATATFSDASTQDVTSSATWNSSDTSVATVSSSGSTQGLAQSITPGTATITASFSGQSSTAILTVSAATISSLSVSPGNPSIAKGTTQQLTATAAFSDNTTQDVTSAATWSSSNLGVATIDSHGLAQSVSAGTTSIKAAYQGQAGSTTLTVTAAAISTISVSPDTASIANGTGIQFTATATFTDGSTQDITSTATWTSSNTAVGSVGNSAGSSGFAQSVGPGTTTITATSGNVAGRATLTVTSPTVASIAITPTTPSIAVGTTQQFKATATMSDTTTQDVTATANWTSSDSSVATINAQGLAQSIGTGTTTIGMSFGGKSATTLLTVTSAVPTGLAVFPTNPSIAKGSTQQFTAVATFSDNTTQDVTSAATWSSSNLSVASINNQGLAQSKLVGSTTIKAVYKGQSGTTTLTVTSPAVSAISVSPSTAKIANGTGIQFRAIATLTDSTTQDVTTTVDWGSSSPSVANVSSSSPTNGFAQSSAPGITTITATSGNASGHATLTVTGATITGIVVTPANATVSSGSNQQYTATASFNDGTTQDVTASATWGSSSASAATISNSGGSIGLASALSAGSTVITATYNGTSGSTNLTVN